MRALEGGVETKAEAPVLPPVTSRFSQVLLVPLQVSALACSSGDAVFKFEPFVLHVQCQQLEDAQLMVRRTLLNSFIYS